MLTLLMTVGAKSKKKKKGIGSEMALGLARKERAQVCDSLLLLYGYSALVILAIMPVNVSGKLRTP